MKQIHQHVIRRSGEILTHQWDSAHDFGQFVHRNTDEIDLAGNGAVVRVVGIIESAAEGEGPIIREIILHHAQRLGFGRAQNVDMI